jgi:SAM-dependent methyltransferase
MYEVRQSIKSHNWLIHRIHDKYLMNTLETYADGLLIDIGCGRKPYINLINKLGILYIGLDHPGSPHRELLVDIFALAHETGIAKDSVNTILCTFVLEHLEFPGLAIKEFYRILSPGGFLILSAPLFWHIHEAPRDYYRFTKYGLLRLFEEAGFEVVNIIALSGFIVTYSQEFVYFLFHFKQGLLKYPIAIIQGLIQIAAYLLHKWDQSDEFTWAYLIIGKKQE